MYSIAIKILLSKYDEIITYCDRNTKYVMGPKR